METNKQTCTQGLVKCRRKKTRISVKDVGDLVQRNIELVSDSEMRLAVPQQNPTRLQQFRRCSSLPAIQASGFIDSQASSFIDSASGFKLLRFKLQAAAILIDVPLIRFRLHRFSGIQQNFKSSIDVSLFSSQLHSEDRNLGMDKYLTKRKASDSSKSINVEFSKRIRAEINLPNDLPSDPGMRTRILDYDPNVQDEVRRAYLLKGPCQPKSHNFPCTLFGQKPRRFNVAWFHEYSTWLEYSVNQDAAYCLCCYLFKPNVGAQGGGETLVGVGLKNWAHKDKLKQHVGRVNSSFDFIFCLHFMKKLLGITNDLSQALQSKDQCIVNAMNLVRICKVQLQMLRDGRWDSMLTQTTLFCEKHEIDVCNMDEMFLLPGRSRRKYPKMTNLHHYRVELFYDVIDLQRTELESGFSEIDTKLLLFMACLNPNNSFAAFDKNKLIQLARLYPHDFSDIDVETLEDQLETYILDMLSSSDFANLNGIGDLAQNIVEIKRDKVYSLVYLLIKLALTLPVLTATVERSFSSYEDHEE
ncbi:hypothetical protein LXL04_029628 [Taraxacum kok-saghyz]